MGVDTSWVPHWDLIEPLKKTNKPAYEILGQVWLHVHVKIYLKHHVDQFREGWFDYTDKSRDLIEQAFAVLKEKADAEYEEIDDGHDSDTEEIGEDQGV